MRYLTLLRGRHSTTPPPPELMEAIMTLGQDATQAGALLDTAGLAPSASGARLSLVGSELTAIDGPFAESKEVISYAIYDVQSKEEVVEWAARFLKAHRDLWPGWEGEVDILKLFGPEDFPAPA
ncbi:YciI family protein [Micromonospora sp. MA102]|uniref:YciI family protein n=1 Tax=Micromonospora sp. MA102 TaxID=2952755 RepID=UPI0021C670D0|nr:YciI family protein [Micromonospora sp. MA102]